MKLLRKRGISQCFPAFYPSISGLQSDAPDLIYSRVIAVVKFNRRAETVVYRFLSGRISRLMIDGSISAAPSPPIEEAAGFNDELVEATTSAKERKLAKQLVETMARNDLDLGEFTNLSTERLTQFIEARVAGKELGTPPAVGMPEVINLMGALKASVEQVKPRDRPAKRKVASAKKPAAAKITRKKQGLNGGISRMETVEKNKCCLPDTALR